MSLENIMHALCFLDLSAPIYVAVGYGLALTLMVMTGPSERGGEGCRD